MLDDLWTGLEALERRAFGHAGTLASALPLLKTSSSDNTLVSSLGDDALKHLAFMIDSSPEVVPLTVDFHEDLVHVPLPWRKRTQLLNTSPADLGGKHRPKPVPPEPDGFMADVDAAFVEQVFDISE